MVQLDVMDPALQKDSCLIFGWCPRSRAESLSIAWWQFAQNVAVAVCNFHPCSISCYATIPLEAVKAVVCLQSKTLPCLNRPPFCREGQSPGRTFWDGLRPPCATSATLPSRFWQDEIPGKLHDQPFVRLKLWKCKLTRHKNQKTQQLHYTELQCLLGQSALRLKCLGPI